MQFFLPNKTLLDLSFDKFLEVRNHAILIHGSQFVLEIYKSDKKDGNGKAYFVRTSMSFLSPSSCTFINNEGTSGSSAKSSKRFMIGCLWNRVD